MSTEIINTNDLQTIVSIAQTFFKAGIFPDTKSVEQAIVKILAGREFGIGPFEAMRGIDIIQGKAAMNSGLISARIKASGKYDYRVLELTDTGCRIQFFQDGQPLEPVSSFVAKDAQAAGLLARDMYKKFPRNMYFARALTNGARWHCSEVFGGAVYTPDELCGNADTLDVEAIEIKSVNGTDPQAEALAKDEAQLRQNYLEHHAKQLENGNYLIEFGSKRGSPVSAATNSPWLENHLKKHDAELSPAAKAAIQKRIEEIKREYAQRMDAERGDAMNQAGTYPVVGQMEDGHPFSAEEIAEIRENDARMARES